MKFDLAVTVREKTGKGAARQLRREGKVPAVLYGQGECLLLTIEPEPLVKILKSQAGSTALISLSISGVKSNPKRTALLRDFQVDPVEGHVLHADLFEISMEKPIRVKVPVHVIGGTPAGVKEGGILHFNMRELSVECLPAAMPDHIEVDASPLAIGQGIHLKDIAKRDGVRYLDDPEQMVVSVAVPMSDAKLEALLTSQAAGPEGAKEPEVMAKGKIAAEGAEGAEASKTAAPAAAADAKAGEKKEAAAAAPKAEKKEAEKKK
ncbi:50S ribosomal protein L25 [Nitrospira japonica]|uniref:Large ribosomal subunit protein bL25 n=1 Tax=Nitrospira japonica TaxID=1325564 RepID=A0A1W1I4J4_9BACT|nr:50S ribosomal protein L25 [Nitrospira japonica]SLM47926.1 50S ribosomal protein L25 [Nitrospira japonica]